MNIRAAITGVLLVCAALVLFAFGFTYSVGENQAALKLSGNEVKGVDNVPGLHFTLPFIERIRILDRRVLSHDYAEDRYVTSDGQILRADFFIAWQVADAAAYFRSTRGSEDAVVQNLGTAAKSALKTMIEKRSLKDAVAIDRNQSATELFNVISAASANLGVKLVDARIHKIGLPESYNESVYTAMRNYFRSGAVSAKAQGDAKAQQIRAQADRERQEILANANRDAAITRGEGDARAATIYAGAYRANAEFFSFYRSMQAYRESIGKSDDVLVISPDSDFFKYFNKPAAR
jgi:membrane protease subunit HflC